MSNAQCSKSIDAWVEWVRMLRPPGELSSRLPTRVHDAAYGCVRFTSDDTGRSSAAFTGDDASIVVHAGRDVTGLSCLGMSISA